jgi:hypothetical protein
MTALKNEHSKAVVASPDDVRRARARALREAGMTLDELEAQARTGHFETVKDESIEELRQIADGRNDILAEAAGITAGSWYAWPSTHVGYELIGAAMLILAGGGRGFPLDYDELERWTRVGFERGMRSRKGER